MKTRVCHHQFLPGLRIAADTDTKLKPLPPLTPSLTQSDHDCLLFCCTSQMPTILAKDSEAKKKSGTCPKSHNYWTANSAYQTDLTASNSHTQNTTALSHG